MQNRNHSAPILSEPKLSYFKHRLFETLTGGLNFESSKNTSILYKLFIYLVPLILIFLPAFLLESFYLAINVSGVAGIFLFLLNMIFQSNISYRTFPMKNNDSSENLNNTFSLKKPKKAKITYIAFIMMAIFLTYFHFFLTTAFLWNTIRNHDLSKEIQIFEFVLISLVTLTSAGSIFLGNPKEFASVLPDDKTYNLFSGIWMRPCFVIIVLIIQISYTDFWYNVIVSIIYFSLWPLWTFGMIGGLFNTFLWVLETINALLFGDGLKIKLRNTVLAFIFNIGLSFILATIIYFQADSLLLIYYLLLTVASLIKTLELDCFKNNKSVLSYAFLEILAVVIPVFVICIVFHQIFQLEYMYFEKNYQIILIILGTITAFFCSIHWMAGIQNRAVYLKILQNMCRNKSLSLNSLKILFRICQWTLCIFLLACSYGFSMRLQLDSERKILSIWLWSSLLLRSFNYCWLFHLKLYLILLESFLIVLVCDLEPYWFFYFSPLLEIGNGFLIRLISRTLSFFYSLYKMKKTKSLRLENSNKFIVLSLTILFPINIINILLASLLNVPIIGIFGLPLFFSGSLRIRRLWDKLNSALNKDFEAYLYKGLLEEIKAPISELIYRFPDEFQPEDYYLIRMGKFLAIFNIIERGSHNLSLNFRGLEMQEPTSCHNLEANSIDNIIKSVFENKSYFYSHALTIMEPLTTTMISNYDDNSFKLTGVIESRDFNKGLKEIYLKLMIYFFDIWYHENADNFLRTIQLLHQEISADIDIPDLMNIFPSSWYDYLKKTHKNKNENFDVKIDIENIKQSPSNKEFEKEEDHVTTPKPKINVEENDMMILLGDLEEIDLMKTDIGMGKLNKPIESKRNEEKQKDLTSSHKTINDKIKEVLIFLFATSINQRNKDLDTKMNEETLFKLFNNGGLLNTRSWPKTIDENSLAKAISSCKNGIRLALKIALEIYAVEGHLLDIKDEDLKKNIKETEDKWFIGNRNSEELFEAINTKKENLMCLLYDFGKKETNVLRATSSKMQAYILKLNEDIIKSIWSNVLFELIYVTNDDEERYSIQSHDTYLRNLIIQSSEEPFGYCSFYSGPVIVNF